MYKFFFKFKYIKTMTVKKLKELIEFKLFIFINKKIK